MKEVLQKDGLNLKSLQRTGKTVAVMARSRGLAATQQLNRAGHTVTVFERDNAMVAYCDMELQILN
jgi:NADPH-dependent glutamate synthase beta subunit-like oxidoreductase